MQIKVDKEENSQLTIQVEVPKETVNRLFSKAFKKIVSQVRIPGFRKGKAPRKIFEQKYGKQPIQEEAIKELYPLVYNKVLEEKKITPLTFPKIELVKFSEDEPAVIKMEIAAKPDVKLGTYKDIKVKRKKIKIDEEEIKQGLENLQKNNAEYPPLLENRPTQEGDWLALEMQPLSTGPISMGAKKEDLWYKLGSDQLPPPFHQQLMGSRIGDEKRVETVIPQGHPQKELAGKRVNLTVKVKDIRKEKLPELNDEFAKKLNFENMESLKKRLKEELNNFKHRKEEERIRGEIVEKITKNSKVDVPSILIEEGLKKKNERLEEELKKKKVDRASLLQQQNLTEEELNKRFKDQVELELKTLLILDKIAQEEKIEVTEDEVNGRLQLLAREEDKEVKAEELKERLIKEGKLEGLMQRIKNEKTIEFLYNQAQISDGILSSLK